LGGKIFQHLKVIYLEGNPIARKLIFNFLKYITTVLTQLNYYEYTFIKNELREEACALGKKKFLQFSHNRKDI